MEDLQIIRRQRSSKGQWKSHEKPCFKLELPRCSFVIFKKTADLLNVKARDAIMFAVSKKNKCGFVYKEDPQDDSYYLSNSRRNYFRFTSKVLADYMMDVFDIKDKNKPVYFDVVPEQDEKGRLKFILSN